MLDQMRGYCEIVAFVGDSAQISSLTDELIAFWLIGVVPERQSLLNATLPDSITREIAVITARYQAINWQQRPACEDAAGAADLETAFTAEIVLQLIKFHERFLPRYPYNCFPEKRQNAFLSDNVNRVIE